MCFSSASLALLAGNDTAQSGLTPRETALAASTFDELTEIVRDLTRRVASCELEIAAHRIRQTLANEVE